MLNFDDIKANYFEKPFPHLIIDNFIEKEIVNKLNDILEASDDLFHHHGWMGKRSSIQFGSSQYKKLISNDPTVNEFHKSITSQETVKKIFDIFNNDAKKNGLNEKYLDFNKLKYDPQKFDFVIGTNVFKKIIIKFFYNPILRRLKLRRYFRYIFSLFSIPTIYPGISISKSIEGYTESSHTDSRHKIFIGLLYLNSLNKGGELNILMNKSEKSLLDANQYIDKSEEKLVKQIKPKPGKLVLFLNSNNAYHSVEGFKGLRRFIYFSFAINNTESLFNTNYTVKLSDLGSDGKI